MRGWSHEGAELLTDLELVQIQLGCYNLRVLNVTPTATTKKTAIECTQKEMRKEVKYFITKYQLKKIIMKQ